MDDYERNPDRALVDAAAHPFFRLEMEADDIEIISVDLGNGTLGQAEALKRSSIRKVVTKLLERLRTAGANVKEWICSPDYFDLCARLRDTPVGEVMRRLRDFLANKWAERGLVIGHVFGIPFEPVGIFFAILSALLVTNKEIFDLCECA